MRTACRVWVSVILIYDGASGHSHNLDWKLGKKPKAVRTNGKEREQFLHLRNRTWGSSADILPEMDSKPLQ